MAIKFVTKSPTSNIREGVTIIRGVFLRGPSGMESHPAGSVISCDEQTFLDLVHSGKATHPSLVDHEQRLKQGRENAERNAARIAAKKPAAGKAAK